MIIFILEVKELRIKRVKWPGVVGRVSLCSSSWSGLAVLTRLALNSPEIHQPLPPKCWDSKCVLPSWAYSYALFYVYAGARGGPEECVAPTGAGVTGICGPPYAGAENGTLEHS